MFRSLKKYLHLDGKRGPTPPRLNAKPGVEALESRWMPSTTTIGGTVFNDLHDTGILVAGDPGIAGNVVELHNTAGQVIDTTTTDVNGNYRFTKDYTINTQPATQEVDATFPTTVTNWSATQSVAQFDPSLGTLTGVDVINDATLTSAIKVQSLDGAPSHVTGHVTGEATLTVGTNLKPLVTDLATDESVDLPAYDNAATFAGAAAHDFGPKSAANTKTLSLSAANGDDLSQFIGTGKIALTEGAVATSSGSGAGNLLSQINSTASGNVRVVYHYNPSNDVRPGQYVVVQPQNPPGYLEGRNTADNVTALPLLPKDVIPVTLNAQNNSTTNNFGEIKPSGLSGFVYVDNDNNGIKETGVAGIGGEPGIGGNPINLTGADDLGNVVNLSTVTGADGSYAFEGLRAGNYTITEPQQPPGYLDGKSSVGSLLGTINEDQFAKINVPPAVEGVNYNFGKLQPAQVGGFVYHDRNNNGVKEAGEPGIGSVTVYLSGVNDQGVQINRAVQTNGDGSYNFGVLYPGTYTLSDLQPANYLPGKNTLGNLGGTQDATHLNVTLGGNAVGTDYNFGNLLPTNPPPNNPPPQNPPPQNPPPVVDSLQSPPPALSKRMFTGGDWTSWAW